MSRTRALCLGALLAGVAGCAAGNQPALSEDGCEDPAILPVRGVVRFDARTFDVIAPPGRGYIVGTSSGPIEVDRCTLRKLERCVDHGGARRLTYREGTSVVDYLRGNGSLASCDLDRPGHTVRAPSETTTYQPRPGREDGSSVWIADGRASAQMGDRPPRELPSVDEALDVALSRDARTVAVADRAGLVSIYELPGGVMRARFLMPSSNVYGIALDEANDRVLAVVGVGGLIVRPLSTPAR